MANKLANMHKKAQTDMKEAKELIKTCEGKMQVEKNKLKDIAEIMKSLLEAETKELKVATDPKTFDYTVRKVVFTNQDIGTFLFDSITKFISANPHAFFKRDG